VGCDLTQLSSVISFLQAFSLLQGIRLVFSIMQARDEEAQKLRLHRGSRFSQFTSMKKQTWYIRTEDIKILDSIGIVFLFD